MSTSYDKHKSQVENARRANGEFGTYESGESGATLGSAPASRPTDDITDDIRERLEDSGTPVRHDNVFSGDGVDYIGIGEYDGHYPITVDVTDDEAQVWKHSGAAGSTKVHTQALNGPEDAEEVAQIAEHAYRTRKVARDGSNPLAPEPKRTIDAFQNADRQATELQKSMRTAEGSSFHDALESLDAAEKQRETALERCAMTEEGRKHLTQRSQDAQAEMETWPQSKNVLGADWDSLSDDEKTHRQSTLRDARDLPRDIEKGRIAQRKLDSFVAETGIGTDAQPVAAAEARRAFPEGSAMEVRYPHGLGSRGVSVERTVTKNSSHQIVSEDETGRSTSGDWRGTKFHKDAHGNYLAVNEQMYGGTPYAVYTPKEN